MSLEFSSATDDAPSLSRADHAAKAPLILQATEGGTLTVPGGNFLLGAEFGRAAGDLVLSGADHEAVVVVRDFFAMAEPPRLETEHGARIEGALAARLAGSPTPGQYAAADDSASSSEPIGKVAELTGDATATRLDGTKLTLAKDVPVFQGDVIETAEGTALKVVFVDESTFAVGESARMVLDEFVYDRGTLEGSSSFSVIEGVFVFVSGGIAENNPDQMVVKTPVATMGIRGTAVAVQAAEESEQNLIILLPEQTEDGQESTGSVKVSTDGGSVVLDEPNEATAPDSVFATPSDTFYALPEDIAFLIRRLQGAIPDSLRYLDSDFLSEDGEKAFETAAALSEIAPAAGDFGDAPQEVIQVTNADPLAGGPFGVVPPPAALTFDFGAGFGGGGSDHDDVPPLPQPLAIVPPEVGTEPPPDFILPGGLFKLAQSVDQNDVLIGGVLHTSGPLGGTFMFQQAGTYTLAWGAIDEGDFVIDSPLLLDSVFLNGELIEPFQQSSFLDDGFTIPTGSDVTFVGNFNGVDPIQGNGQLKLDGVTVLIGDSGLQIDLTIAEIEALLPGLAPGALAALADDGNPNTTDLATGGSVLLFEITVEAGDVLSFGYNFIDTDINGGPNAAFNDFAFFYVNADAAEGDGQPSESGDVLFGGLGNDEIDALAGNDTVFGSGGEDILVGNDGDDTLFAGAGNDVASGDDGLDRLFGGAGDDELDGGADADLLAGGTGINVLTGGGGADAFFFQSRADGIDVANDEVFEGDATLVSDFASGVDKFVFQNTEFGFAFGTTGTLADIETATGATLFSAVSNYDGSGITEDTDQPHFIFDIVSKTLYFDGNVTTPGYTVIAEVQGDAVSASDIQISNSA